MNNSLKSIIISKKVLRNYILKNKKVYSSSTSYLDTEEKYPGHIPTNAFQKVLLSVGSSVLTFLNPARGGKHYLIQNRL